MFLVPARIVFWGCLDLFFIFYFHKMRKKKRKKNEKKKNSQKIRRKSSKEENKLIFFVLWTAVHYSVLIIFPLHSQKLWKKKSPNYPRKQEKDRDGIVVQLYLPNSAPKTADISQLSKPKHRLRYKWGQVSFTKYVFTNMWIWFTFLKRVWSWIFVWKFTFLLLFMGAQHQITTRFM